MTTPASPDPVRRAERLLERDAELRAIDGLVSQAADGDAGLLVIEGQAGIGKTRLVAEVRRRAGAAGLRILTARGSELEREFPFGVIRQLFEAPVMEDGEALLRGAAAPARVVFSPDAMHQPEADGSFATLHGLYWLAVNVAGDDPLVLVVDDLHWCDRPSLRALAYLVRRLEGLPITVVVSLRPAEPGVDLALIAEITSDPIGTAVHPSPLTSGAADALIGDRLGAEPDATFSRLCHQATGGNPLLLNELLKAMRAEGVQPDAGHADAVRSLGHRAASRAVLVRLSRLPADVVEVARTTAILGEGADLDDVAALAGIDPAAAAAATGELARVEILRPELPLGFVHPLVRAAVYHDLPPAERALRHERAARHLAAAGAGVDAVASPLLMAPRHGDPWVVDALTAAARAALRQGAPESAATYLDRAVTEPPPDADRAALLLELGTVEMMIDGRTAVEHLRAAHEASTEPVERARAAEMLGTILFFLGQAAEGAALVEDAARHLTDPRDDDLRKRLDAVRLTVALYDPSYLPLDSPEFPRYRERVYGDGVGDRLLEAVTAYHWAMSGGPADRCVPMALHAVRDGVLVNGANGSVPLVGAQVVLIQADREEGLEATTEAFRVAHERGSLFAVTAARLFRGLALRQRGELGEAEAILRAALEEVDTWGFVSVRLFPGSLLADLLIEQGDLAGAAAALEHANPGGATMPENTNSGFWLASRLRFLVAAGDTEGALAVSEDCRRRFADTVVNPAWQPWRSLRAIALERVGRTAEAVALAEEELTHARTWGGPRTISRSLRILAGLRREAGLPLLEEAVAITEGSVARLEHAKALAAHGALLRISRRPTEARDPLRRALEIAAACEARPLVERIRTELYATGARPRADVVHGVGSLTASERRVADLACEGQSNKDIAQALYVTPKTIEVHLSNAYRKLGIRSRRELAGALARG